ncbi:aminopeptidase N isoform X1 [Pieris rapae]|uniref:aminopeptidase N isoform X1 n=1 Tax=Pieris rapae TaxID=64459 RepID=UPI001E27C836|nr:aminopeptidase N isoform X1 [Pieris rapae]
MGVFKLIVALSTIIATISTLPLRSQTSHDLIEENLKTQEDSFTNFIIPEQTNIILEDGHENRITRRVSSTKETEEDDGIQLRNLESSSRNNLRPDMTATRYDIKLTPNIGGGTFAGIARISVQVTDATIGDAVKFHFEGLTVSSVKRISGGTSSDINNVNTEDGVIEIDTGVESTLHDFEIQYTGTLASAGIGFYTGAYDGDSYVAMNLHPTNARRVFPCIDEPNIQTTISLTFAGLNSYNHVIANSKRLAEQPNANELQFEPLPGTPHLWGMIAHNMNAANLPTSRVIVYTRPGRNSGDQQSNVAISSYFNFFNNFTGKPYENIIANQQGELHIMALPDVDRDWYALSTMAIWEPYIVIEVSASAKQKQIGFVEIAQAMARQWFGYVLAPTNWRHQWVITGLGRYTAYEAARALESNPDEIARIDMDHVFVSDVIQESLLYDSYTNALPLQISADIYDEDAIRNHINGLLKTKAPAIMRMLSLVLSQNSEVDYIRNAAATLFNTASLSNVNSRNFYDTLSTVWGQATPLINNVIDFIEPWILNNNYPVVRIEQRQGSGVIVTQERFGFASRPQMNFMIPLSFTTRVNPDFNNIYPTHLLEASTTISMDLGDEDWVIFNVQGQGYYRVNYDNELWERIIEALEDEEQRNIIHPINRATILDDALNLARSGRVEYSIALRIVLTLNLETEYVVWKAFDRNMHILRNHLEALVDGDEDLDQDIYQRVIRRIMMTAETDLTFTPELNVNERAMRSLSRGLIMDISCRGGYEPCIAAAVDLFRNPTDNTVVNPNIPADLHPAVFCTNVMTGGEEERELLEAYLTTINNQYERVVVLESLACSRDDAFIQSYLAQVAADNSPYNSEEKTRIIIAIIKSHFQNAKRALDFISRNTAQIRNALGGPEKLEEILYALSRNIANGDMTTDFTNWVNSLHSNLDTSLVIAERLRDQVQQDMDWNRVYLNTVYEWIDENDAPTLVGSIVLLSLSVLMALFN